MDNEALQWRRLARRWRLLQVVGVALILLAVTEPWSSPADLTLPETRPFLLLLGIMVEITGLGMARRRPHGGR
jgi:hypothetical protein